MSDRDADFDAISEKDIYEEAKDRLQIALEAESADRALARDDLLFCEGDQWDDPGATSVSMQEPELTINLTDSMVRRVVNNMRQQRPRGKAHPVGDGADIDVAEVINGIGRHVETRSEAGVAYDTAGEMAVKCGWGYFRLIAEYVDPKSFQKDLRILPIRNIFTVYMDPASIMPSACDANWCLLSVTMPRTEYKRLYPRMLNVDWKDLGRGDKTAWENKEQVRLAEYFRICEKSENLYLLKDPQGQEHPMWESDLLKSPQGRLTMDQVMPLLMQQGMTIEGKRESARRQVEWFRLNGKRVVEREQLPGQWIPVFRVQGNVTDVDGKVMRRGMVRAMQDAQRMVNYGETAKIKRLGLAKKAQFMAAEGQLDGHPEWDGNNVVPNMTLTWKPITVSTAQGDVLLPPPQALPPAQIEAGFSEFVQGMRTNLLAIAGMPQEPGQDMQGQVISGQALRRRQAMSDQSHFQYYDNQTLAIAQCWRVMVEWTPVYFPEPGRIQRVIGEDSTPRMVTLNKRTQENGVTKIQNDLSVGRYDIVMDTGPGYETKREEGAENLIQLLSVQPLAEIIAKVGPDLVFRSIDHPYMQELADRLMASTPEGLEQVMEDMPERARSLIQSMYKQIQALQQQLQTTETDLKAGITKAHLAATVKAHDVEESNKTKRADTESRERTSIQVEAMRGHVTLAKEEIAAGASLLNTHVEAKYHEREAERMIEESAKAEKTN